MNYKELHNGISIREGFEQFHAKNPHVYEVFERLCKDEFAKGVKYISPKKIMNVMRFSGITTEGSQFRINDAHISYYGRLFIEKNPEYAQYVRTRKLRNEQPRPYATVGKNGQLAFL